MGHERRTDHFGTGGRWPAGGRPCRCQEMCSLFAPAYLSESSIVCHLSTTHHAGLDPSRVLCLVGDGRCERSEEIGSCCIAVAPRGQKPTGEEGQEGSSNSQRTSASRADSLRRDSVLSPRSRGGPPLLPPLPWILSRALHHRRMPAHILQAMLVPKICRRQGGMSDVSCQLGSRPLPRVSGRPNDGVNRRQVVSRAQGRR